MEEKAQTLLSKYYAPAVLNRLTRFPSQEQWTIAAWLVQTPIGTNYALQILEQLEDLARKEEVRASRLLADVLGALPQEHSHPKKVGRKVRDILSRRLHPVSFEYGEKFKAFEQELSLNGNVKLFPPKNFEGNIFALGVKFQSPQDLAQKLEEVQASIKAGKWEKLREF